MTKKIANIEKNKTKSLIDLPIKNEAIGLKWIYESKFNPDVTF